MDESILKCANYARKRLLRRLQKQDTWNHEMNEIYQLIVQIFST
jgi:hypothetical protein